MSDTTPPITGRRQVYAQQHDRNGRRIRTEARVLEIDPADWKRARDGDTAEYGTQSGVAPTYWVATTDYATGDTVEVAVAPCGLGCRCAAAWRKA